VRLTLAAALGRLGRTGPAARLYRQLAKGAAQPLTRQNALAYLARMLQSAGQRTKAAKAWRDLLAAHPKTVHRREALLALVRATCKRNTPPARKLRRTLRQELPGDATAVQLLRSCGAPSPR
jgi:cytochrome c-type biogenesis protein CcmH/NrfG